MNAYMCMATDWEQGMLELVSPADTLANIQHWYKNEGEGSKGKRALFEWLKHKHKDPKE